MVQDNASALLGVEGLHVTEAEAEADGTVTVWAVTDHPGAWACPDCGTVSVAVHEYVLTRPRDLRRGLDEVCVAWLKRRWKCQAPACERKTFTESLPAVPADGAAAAAGRSRGRRAGLHGRRGGPLAAHVVAGGPRRLHRSGGPGAGPAAGPGGAPGHR